MPISIQQRQLHTLTPRLIFDIIPIFIYLYLRAYLIWALRQTCQANIFHFRINRSLQNKIVQQPKNIIFFLGNLESFQ